MRENNSLTQMMCTYGSLTQRELVLKNQNADDIVDFQFPSLNFTRRKWYDGWVLHRELVRLGIKANFRAGKVYSKTKRVNKKKVSIVYKCTDTDCKAFLFYQQDNKPNSEVKLLQFENLHHHRKSKDLELAKREDICYFVLNLDENVIDNYIETKKWIDKFDLSKGKSLEIIQRVLWQNNTEEQILTRFCKKTNVKIRRYCQDVEKGRTELIFMSSDSMRDTFLHYGETISVGFTDSILTEKSVFGEKYTIGCFFAHDENLRLLVVGSFAMMRVREENWKKLFEFFYECVCQNQDLVQSFVFDSLSSLYNGVLQFRQEKEYKFEILNDWLHVIQRDLKPKLMPLSNGKQVLEKLTQAFMQVLPEKYERILEESLKMLPQKNKYILEEFKMKADRYCFSKMSRKFQSFSMSSTFVKDVTVRTNQMPIYKNHTGRLFYQYLFIQNWLLKVSNSTVSSVRIGPIKHFSNELIFLRQKIQKKVMDLLVKKYTQSKQLQKIKLDELTYRIIPQQSKERGVIVRFNIQYDHWECQCSFLYLCGLPCEHLFCIVRGMKGSIAYYINSRWFHKKEHLVVGRTMPGAHTSHKTRRRL